jgi:Skp family chaperone for outer membrane proteins
MSQKLILSLVLLLALGIWGVAQNPPATNPPPAAPAAAPAVIGPAKIAFVNIQVAVATCDEGKKEEATLQQYIDAKSRELQDKQKALETLKNNFDIQGSKLSDDARQDLADTIDARDTELQRFQQDTQADINKRRQKYQTAIARKMVNVISKLAKDKALSAVQFMDPNRDGYIDPSLDMTDEVIKSYNQVFPVATAPAVAPVKK